MNNLFDFEPNLAAWRPGEIISGGQTGADRGGLDAGIELGIPTGGWVPRGRAAEDGRVPDSYPNMREAPLPAYILRTKLNVRDSDGTMVFTWGVMSGGTLHTWMLANGKPRLEVDLKPRTLRRDFLTLAADWLEEHKPRVLNIAGPRESKRPGMQLDVLDFLRVLWR